MKLPIFQRKVIDYLISIDGNVLYHRQCIIFVSQYILRIVIAVNYSSS